MVQTFIESLVASVIAAIVLLLVRLIGPEFRIADFLLLSFMMFLYLQMETK